jgi:hypothetical protein
MKPQDFNINDWVFEVSSGFTGYRNIHTNEWIYDTDYFERKRIKYSHEKWQDIMLEYSLETTNESLFDFLLRNYHSPIKINTKNEN